MAKQNLICICGRVTLFEGSINRIEAALNHEGLPAITNELETLLAYSEVELRQRAIDLAVVIEIFCNEPERLRRNELNWLAFDIWEIKFGVMRLVFTSANCPYVRRERRLELAGHVIAPSVEANTARATSMFIKQGEKAPLSEIRKAKAIAREDRRNESH